MSLQAVPTSQAFATQLAFKVENGQREFIEQVQQDKAPILKVGAVTALGSSISDAAPITDYPVINVAGGNGALGVILPKSAPGKTFCIHNRSGSGALLVYPDAAGYINAVATHGAASISANCFGIFTCIDGTYWGAVYL